MTIAPELSQNGWSLTPDKSGMHKTYRFTDFPAAIAWMTQIAFVAERLNHHPEWKNVYNRVEVVLTTHDAGGLTEKDTDLASRMDALYLGYTDGA